MSTQPHPVFNGLSSVSIQGEEFEILKVDAHVSEEGVTGIAVELLHPAQGRVTMCIIFDPAKHGGSHV